MIQEVELVEGRGHPGQKSWILKFRGIDSVDQVRDQYCPVVPLLLCKRFFTLMNMQLGHMMTLFVRVLLLLICFVAGIGSTKWFYLVVDMKSCNQCKNGNP